MAVSSETGYQVEGWVCYGMPTEPLTSEQREDVIEYARLFEECDQSREELAALGDHDLIRACYQAMADYARGQM